MKSLKSVLMVLILSVSTLFPIASQSAAMTNNWENSLIDFLFRGQTYTPPATIYIALFTTCPTDSTSGTEVSGGSYARVAVTSSLRRVLFTKSMHPALGDSGPLVLQARHSNGLN